MLFFAYNMHWQVSLRVFLAEGAAKSPWHSMQIISRKDIYFCIDISKKKPKMIFLHGYIYKHDLM